jgi:hypothetical protein
MGAHPGDPSHVIGPDGTERSLLELVDADPVTQLGERCATRWGGRLPFLLKILAAEEPLSMQAHPSAAQAAEGHAREERLGIPRDAPNRNYPDPTAKPELVCALTEFHALAGFRAPDRTVKLLKAIETPGLGKYTGLLEAQPDPAGLRALLWKTTGSFERVFFGSDTHADGLLAGSLAGLLLSQGWVPPSRLLKLAAHVVLGVLFLFLYWGWLADAYVLAGGLFILNLGMTALVVALVRDPGPLLLGFFEFGPLAWLGRISYGVYLWHMVVFGLSGRLPLLKRAGSWPLTIALTIAVAALSFYLLERPLLRLKRRFSRVSPQSP